MEILTHVFYAFGLYFAWCQLRHLAQLQQRITWLHQAAQDYVSNPNGRARTWGHARRRVWRMMYSYVIPFNLWALVGCASNQWPVFLVMAVTVIAVKFAISQRTWHIVKVVLFAGMRTISLAGTTFVVLNHYWYQVDVAEVLRVWLN